MGKSRNREEDKDVHICSFLLWEELGFQELYYELRSECQKCVCNHRGDLSLGLIWGFFFFFL